MRVREKGKPGSFGPSLFGGTLETTMSGHHVRLDGSTFDTSSATTDTKSATGGGFETVSFQREFERCVDNNLTKRYFRQRKKELAKKSAKTIKQAALLSEVPWNFCEHTSGKVTSGAEGSISFRPLNQGFTIDGGLLGNLDHSDIKIQYSKGFTYTPRARLASKLLPPSGYDPAGATTGKCGMIDLARKNAVEAILPGIKSRWEAPLFLKECADLRTMAIHIGRILARIGPGLFRYVCDYLMGKMSRKRLANHHLMVQFGLLPIIGDFSKIYDVMKNFHREAVNYMMNADKLLVSHSQEALRFVDYNLPGDVLDIGFDGGESYMGLPVWTTDARNYVCELVYDTTVRVEPSKSKYWLTTSYKYTLPPVSHDLMVMMMACDALGLNFSPKQFWQMVPFSFMVDWCWSVSSYLQTNANLDWSKGYVSIHQTTETVAYDWSRRVTNLAGSNRRFYTQGNSASPWEPFDDTLSISDLAAGRVYVRRPIAGLPCFSLPGLRMPSGMQMLSAMSLLVQGLG